MTRQAAIAALVILASAAQTPAPVQAQSPSGPSFDCAKASNPVERAICGNAGLAAADRILGSAYATLLGRLDRDAREHLEKDQVRWIADRNVACAGGTREIEACLKDRYRTRRSLLAASAVAPYPFVSEHALIKRGKVKATSYLIDARYPAFDAPSANFAAANKFFADMATTGADDAMPDGDIRADDARTYSYDQSFELFRPTARTVSVETHDYRFTGGAHGNGGTLGALVDLQSGRLVRPDEIFAGEDWRRILRETVTADLKKQFVERPGFDDALEPAKMDKRLSDPGHYVWRPDRLELVFNHYDVAAYVMGAYRVVIPYAQLRALLKSDGPLAGMR